MKTEQEIIDKLCFKVMLEAGGGKWVDDKAKYRCVGFIEALKWLFETSNKIGESHENRTTNSKREC